MPQIIRATRGYRLRGDCMQPLLADGDFIWARGMEFEALQPGDIAVFARFEESRPCVVAHRMLGREDGKLLTQADARTAPDAPLGREDFIGALVAFEKGGRKAALTEPWTRRYDRFCRLWGAAVYAFARERIVEPLRHRGHHGAAAAVRALILAPPRLLFRLLPALE